MTRQSRTLLIVGLVAIIGITALVLLADRYRRMVPMKSVADLEAVPRGQAGTSEDPVAGEPAPETGRDEAPAVAGSTDLSTTPAWRQIDGFVAVRRVVKEKIDENRRICESALDEETGKLRERMPEGVFLPLNMFLIDLSVAKYEALTRAGITSDDYEATKEALYAWQEGDSPDDPSLEAVLEKRRDELSELELGKFKAYDFPP